MIEYVRKNLAKIPESRNHVVTVSHAFLLDVEELILKKYKHYEPTLHWTGNSSFVKTCEIVKAIKLIKIRKACLFEWIMLTSKIM